MGQASLLLPGPFQGPRRPAPSNPFVSAHTGMIPEGPVLFLGAAGGADAAKMARQGRPVTLVDDRILAAEQPDKDWETSETSPGIRGDQPLAWQLGYQRWAGIVALYCQWPETVWRHLMGQVPNALIPGGVLLLEGQAMGPAGPMNTDDTLLDPEELRPELDILFLSRFAVVSRPLPEMGLNPARVLQVVGVHLEPNDQSLWEAAPAPRRRRA